MRSEHAHISSETRGKHFASHPPSFFTRVPLKLYGSNVKTQVGCILFPLLIISQNDNNNTELWQLIHTTALFTVCTLGKVSSNTLLQISVRSSLEAEERVLWSPLLPTLRSLVARLLQAEAGVRLLTLQILQPSLFKTENSPLVNPVQMDSSLRWKTSSIQSAPSVVSN